MPYGDVSSMLTRELNLAGNANQKVKGMNLEKFLENFFGEFFLVCIFFAYISRGP